uniref:Pyrin domain-containing protein n=1 Tax=Mastacembelus armatus TaxID=205130 RepID=A0A3Q3RZA3_9TELE
CFKTAPTRVREMLLKVLENLKEEEFKQFKWYLQDSDIVSRIPRSRLEKTDMLDLVDLMLQTYGQHAINRFVLQLLCNFFMFHWR